MDKMLRDYTEFLGAVFLFRAARDMDTSCCPGPPPELWLDMRLENLESDKDMDPETKEWILIASKMAELIDDRKAWLLEEVEADLDKATANLTAAEEMQAAA